MHPHKVYGEQKVEIPVKVFEELTLALYYCVERWNKGVIEDLLARQLSLNVQEQVINRCEVVVTLIQFGSYQYTYRLV